MRRLGLTVLAVLVGLGGVLVLPATAAGAAEADGSDVSVTRYGGADRYATSLQVADAVAADAGGSLSSVVLVSGRRWTDAVVAAPLAGALGAPVLMTPPDELRDDALEFLQRAGITRAVVVGPDASGGEHGPGRGVGAGVLEALEEAGIAAERVAGDDRYGASVAAARRISPRDMADLGRTAIVASGEVFADALVAGPFAARGGHPVLLTPPGELHADVAAYLGEAGIAHVVLMGGTAALSDAVEISITELGLSVTRLAGATRYDTAVKAAELVDGRYSDAAGRPCFASSTIGAARGRVPFDSFSAAPLLSRLCAPLVLADPKQIPADTAAYLDAARETHRAVDLRVFGGDAAVSEAAIDAYLTGEDPSSGEDATGDESDEAAEPDDAVPGVLPAGACGGLASDPMRRLSDHPKSEDPAWSPDCTMLVYSQQGYLYVADADGSNARRLVTFDGAFIDAPAWSPDGTRIAYVRGSNDENGHWSSHIWTVNADGSHNNQRTDGDVEDQEPSWSPDGKRIAFHRFTGSGRDEDGDILGRDRHIVVMTSFGNKPKALHEGGRWEQSPAWSPDGTVIAFIADGTVWTMNPDGDELQPLAGGALRNGGLAWSPDGTHVVFSHVGGDGGADLVVVAADGIGARRVTDLRGWAMLPRWSPDGASIGFAHFDQEGAERDLNGTRFASAIGVDAGEPLPWAAECRPRGVSGTTAGFPLPGWAPPAIGTVRVAVLFVDFPDIQAADTTQAEAALGLPWAEQYLETVSFGRLDVEFVPHHEWLRAPNGYEDYVGQSASGSLRVHNDKIYDDAVALVDDQFDFSSFDSLAVVLPSTHFGGGLAGGSVEADGVSLRRHIINNLHLGESGEPDDWGRVAAHELVHNLGLLDMYPYDRSVHARPDPPGGHEWIPVRFGLMELDAYYLADASLLLRRTTRANADGSTSWWEVDRLRPLEMLSWSRWQLGWLDRSQLHCGDEDATVRLAPIAQPDDAVAAAVVPLTGHEVMVVESRRKLGYDRGREFTWAGGGTGRGQALLEEGVLVYTVDSLGYSGDLPVQVAGDSGNGQVDRFPVLKLGESVTLRGYAVTVTADDGDTHTVSIQKQ